MYIYYSNIYIYVYIYPYMYIDLYNTLYIFHYYIYKTTQSRQKLSNASHASFFGCVVPDFL